MELGRQIAVFRSSIAATAAMPVVAALVGAVATLAILSILERPVLAPAITVFESVLIVVGIIVAAGWLYSRVIVHEGGLRGYDFNGRYHRISWASIRSVRESNVLGLRYIVVSSGEANVEIWVPVFIRDREVFLATLRQSAGPEHLLTRAFESSA